MSIIATEFEALGIEGTDVGTFVQAIPYQFYAILALLLVPLIAFGKRDFGPMLKSEEIAQIGLTEEQKAAGEEVVVSEDKKVSAWNMGLPLIVLFATIFIMFFSWGWPAESVAGSKIRVALTSGYFLASITLGIMIIKQKLMSFNDVFDTFIGGIKKMAGILVIIICAWGVGGVCGDLGTSTFIVDSTVDVIPASLVPAMLFLIGAVISFATGTSWGTFAIYLPISVPLAAAIGAPIAPAVGLVVSGGIFGDHCSPISDTTIMSSAGAQCYHINHVSTQIPYACTVAAVSVVCYIIAGFVRNAAISLVIAFVLMALVLLILKKVFGTEEKA